MRKQTSTGRGFSLVELSIVLVILGLLVGGVLSGQSLIRAAELRAVTTEYNRYTTAVMAFRDKYFALPGDMNNATSFWGTDAGGCPGNNTTATAPGIPTCNGDGDGMVSNFNPWEIYRAWQQLADAGLIEGSYTGVGNNATTSTSCCYSSTTTPNVPKSKLNNGTWLFYYTGDRLISGPGLFDGSYGHTLIFAGGAGNVTPLIRPEEAWNIDTKIDDGKPGTGRVVSRKDMVQTNATTGCSDTAYTVATLSQLVLLICLPIQVSRAPSTLRQDSS